MFPYCYLCYIGKHSKRSKRINRGRYAYGDLMLCKNHHRIITELDPCNNCYERSGDGYNGNSYNCSMCISGWFRMMKL